MIVSDDVDKELREAVSDFGLATGGFGVIIGAVIWFAWATIMAMVGGIWPNNRFNGENLQQAGWLAEHTAGAAIVSVVASIALGAGVYVLMASDRRDKISRLRVKAGHSSTSAGLLGGLQGAALGTGAVGIFIFYSIIAVVAVIIVPLIVAILALTIVIV